MKADPNTRSSAPIQRRAHLLGFCLLVMAFHLCFATSAFSLEKVTLQLKWLHQFQFAGFYAAKALGYYRDAGLDVEFLEAKPNQAVVDAVVAGTAQYGVDDSRLLLARAKGKPVVALGVIFQHSPAILLVRQDFPAQNVHDLIGKRIMLDESAEDIAAYLVSEGLTNDKFTQVAPSFNLQDLIDGKVDAISAYLTNEPYYLDQMGFKYLAFTPRSAGIDFYGDTLFTSEQELTHHPDRVKAFREASLRGWKYAMAHPEELVDLILAKYSQRKSRDHLLFEAKQMELLIQPELVEMGYMNPGRWRHIADTYADLGLLPRDFSLAGFLYDPNPKIDHTHFMTLAAILSLGLLITLGIVVLLRRMVRLKTEDLNHANRVLAEQSKMMASIINGTTDAVFIKDTDGKYVVVNDEVVRLFDRPRDEILGRDDTHFFPAHEAKLVMDSDRAIMAGSRVVTKEEAITTLGQPKIYLTTKGPVSDDLGKVVGLFGISRDITGRKKVEEERKELEQQFQQVQKLESLGVLAGGIAHDFNNILAGVYGNVSLARAKLSKDHPAHTAVAFLAAAEESMNRATLLSGQLLTFAKGGDPVKETLSIVNLIHETVNFNLSGSNVKAMITQADNLWFAEADQGQLQQVVSNLTINAKQSMPDGGYLYIRVENAEIPGQNVSDLASGKYLLVTVSDEGVGISPEHLERIFDPYFTTKQAGSGLGLATVYSIIKKHGGHISAKSQIGKGTTFTLYLPASESMKQLAGKKDTTLGPLERTGKILVLDDDEVIRLTVAALLEELGFSVETAAEGRQALDLYQKDLADGKPFDLVILDLTIPGGMGGKEVAKDLLVLDPEAKIVVSSGYADDPVMANHRKYGFQGVIAKPYNLRTLSDLVSRVLSHP